MTNIQQLLDESVLFHDYRRRDAQDLSGNSNNGTLTAVNFDRNGTNLTGTSSVVTVADSVELRLEEMTLVCFNQGGFVQYDGYFPRLIDGKGIDIYLRVTNQISIEGVLVAITGNNKKCIGVYAKDGEIADAYIDGVYNNSTGSVVSITANSNTLYINNVSSLSKQMTEGLSSILMFPRELTATEHAELYGYLSSLTYPSKTNAKPKVEDPELLVDGDMEADNITAWTAGANTTLSKETDSPYAGTRWLKILNTLTSNGSTHQTILTIGKEYCVTGWGRGDAGTGKPRLYQGGGVGLLWDGTNSTSWQYFNIRFVALSTSFLMQCGSTTSADFSGFDNVSVQEIGANDWKTDWAANVSDADVTAGLLENTPFTVGAGQIQINSDTINGQDVKVITPTLQGFVSMPTSTMGQTPTEAAYGEWEGWFKTAVGWSHFVIVGSSAARMDDASQSGYFLEMGSTNVRLYEVTGGSPTLIFRSSAIDPDTWFKLNVTRTSAGVFSIYFNDVLMTAVSGTNPVTNTDHITSNYIVIEQDAGDMVSLGDISGNHSIVKKLL